MTSTEKSNRRWKNFDKKPEEVPQPATAKSDGGLTEDFHSLCNGSTNAGAQRATECNYNDGEFNVLAKRETRHPCEHTAAKARAGEGGQCLETVDASSTESGKNDVAEDEVAEDEVAKTTPSEGSSGQKTVLSLKDLAGQNAGARLQALDGEGDNGRGLLDRAVADQRKKNVADHEKYSHY
ncbi:unnamed protein product, partial [Amoebophrya sp. A25]|eukprot:GSA25T00004336001.1